MGLPRKLYNGAARSVCELLPVSRGCGQMKLRGICGFAIDQNALVNTVITWSVDRDEVSHASSARAGRSRQRQSKWAGSRVGTKNGAGNGAVSLLRLFL